MDLSLRLLRLASYSEHIAVLLCNAFAFVVSINVVRTLSKVIKTVPRKVGQKGLNFGASSKLADKTLLPSIFGKFWLHAPPTELSWNFSLNLLEKKSFETIFASNLCSDHC